MAAVNACLRSPAARPEQLLLLLEPLGLPREDGLSVWAAPLYLREMAAVQREQGSDLSAAAVRGALRLLPPLAAANAAVAAQEPHSLWQALTNTHLYIMVNCPREFWLGCFRNFFTGSDGARKAVSLWGLDPR